VAVAYGAGHAVGAWVVVVGPAAGSAVVAALGDELTQLGAQLVAGVGGRTYRLTENSTK
jgi:hypothetical protein